MEEAERFRVWPVQRGPLFPATGLLKSQSQQICFQVAPSHMLIQFVVVLNICKPNAGLMIAFRCAAVIRGIKNPLLGKFTSRPAEGSAGALLAVMETPPF